jgi:type I restriction enzyme, S subunit
VHDFDLQNVLDILPEGWEVANIQSLSGHEPKTVISGPFGSNIGRRFFVDDGVPVIRGNNLTIDLQQFKDDGFVFLEEDKAAELGTWAIRRDLIFTAAGTIGQVGLIPDDSKYEKYIISNKQIRARLDPHRVNHLFAYYWFSSQKMRQQIERQNTGSTIPLINLSVVRALPVPLPPLVEQGGIIEVLSSLDEKIELNRKQNRTLEAIAQALFKHWFVDFEFPDENGRPYKSSGGAMQPSEFGEIPVGWEAEIGDLLTLSYGKALKTEKRVAGEYPVIGSSGVVGYHNKSLVGAPGITVGRKGTVGSVYWMNTPFYPIDTTFFVEPKLGPESWHFLYFLLKSQNFALIGSDSAVPGLNRDQACRNPGVKPGRNQLEAFSDFCGPLFSKMRTNEGQIQTLTKLRDTLLPKLMSGELRVA